MSPRAVAAECCCTETLSCALQSPEASFPPEQGSLQSMRPHCKCNFVRLHFKLLNITSPRYPLYFSHTSPEAGADLCQLALMFVVWLQEQVLRLPALSVLRAECAEIDDAGDQLIRQSVEGAATRALHSSSSLTADCNLNKGSNARYH